MDAFTLIVPAAGASRRFGGGNKLLHPLGGHPVILRTLQRFRSTPLIKESIREVVIACGEDLRTTLEGCLEGNTPVHFVKGGVRRQDSVRNALSLASCPYVLVHDAARPLVSPTLIERVLIATIEYGAAVPIVPITDTVKSVETDHTGVMRVRDTQPRESLYRAQTPQGFQKKLLEKAYARWENEAPATDESMLVEAAGIRPVGVPGETTNIKITTKEDVETAEYLLRRGHNV